MAGMTKRMWIGNGSALMSFPNVTPEEHGMNTLHTTRLNGLLKAVGNRFRTAQPVPCWTEYLRKTK